MNNVQQYINMSKRFLRNRDQKIIDIERAFTELINSTGYDKVTLRQIAGKAGVSVGIIYRYYPKGKPSIAASIFEKNFRETLIPYSFEEDSDKLENMFYNHLVGHRDNLELYRAFDLAMLADNEVFESVKKDRRRILVEFALDNNYSVENVDLWLTVYSVVDAVIHRHLFVNKVCETDRELLQLIQVLYFSILDSELNR